MIETEKIYNLAQYQEFLQSKVVRFEESGFAVEDSDLNPHLFDFQRWIVRLALRKGRFAIFADCGLGKTLMQLEWANLVVKHTGKPVLILAPLAVSGQTINEGVKFGIDVEKYTDTPTPGIYISNYEQIENIDCSAFAGIVLDESSILKNFDGKTKELIIDRFRETPYKLCNTATPSPNDVMELGNHAEFLNVMSRNEMLSMYFVHDGGETATWRLKGHAVNDFWGWVALWSVMLAKPQDLGFEAHGYELPELTFHEYKITTPKRDNGQLFNEVAVSATNFNQELRITKVERLEQVAEIVQASDENFIIWVKQNEEADHLNTLIPGAIEVRGTDSSGDKVEKIEWFLGDKCVCKLSPKYVKLSVWPTTTRSNTINDIESENSTTKSCTNNSAATSKRSTLKTTTQPTKINGSELKKKTLSETENGASDTLQTRNTEIRLRPQPSQKETETLSPTIETVSGETTGLLSQNTKHCLNGNKINARSAAGNHPSSLSSKDSTSTTATPPEKSEDFSASTATTPSENSKTIQNSSKTHYDICGRSSSKKVLISKVKILGMGMNFQNCHNQIFASLDFSFEGLYQAIRRSYRFGQEHPVHIYLITTDTMQNVIEAIQRKEEQFKEMQEQMIKASNQFNGTKQEYVGKYDRFGNERVTLVKGDCIQLIPEVPDESVGFSIFSPPFASLYTYSDKLEDMGNCSSYDEFQYSFSQLVYQLFRVMQSGRNVAVHCMDLPIQKGKEGFIGLRDFSGLIRECFDSAGFIYHSRVTIWKDPVTEMQRTKALGLLHKQVKKDAAMSRVGIPDYLLIFRKPGEHKNPVRCDIPVEMWQQYASPVWLDIDYGKTLNGREGRHENDERHICPLQLETIERSIHLWTNEGDTVLTPFAGIGSEVYQALKMNRKAIGFELKDSYFDVAVRNAQAAIEGKKQISIFDVCGA